MEVRSRADAEPFTTADGSTIRVLLDAEAGGARNQSLAEALLAPGQATERHYHAETEELYVMLAGAGEMEMEGERREVGPGDAILIPAGRVAPDPRGRGGAPVPVLLRPAVPARGHVLRLSTGAACGPIGPKSAQTRHRHARASAGSVDSGWRVAHSPPRVGLWRTTRSRLRPRARRARGCGSRRG